MGIIRKKSQEDDRDRWSEVDLRTYRGTEGPRGTKQILLGPDDGAPNFAMRVFHLAPGKSSNEEEHAFDHGVMVLRGRCRVLLGDTTHDLEPGDVVWVEPNEHHRFDSVGPDVLEFLCVVPAWGEVDARKRCPAE